MIQHRINQFDAVRRLGPGWASFRVRYALEHRLGIRERRSPIATWDSVNVADPNSFPSIVKRSRLRDWLVEHYDDSEVERLRGHATNLKAHRFDVFGTSVEIDSWSHDPIGDYTYETGRHWSDVPHHRGVDVKRVWEPSRFGWAFDLARLHLIDPTAGAADTFWHLLEWWMDDNPPNEGINWWCGQEASIRLMAIVLCVDAMRDTLNRNRSVMVNRLIHATGNRVLSNIAYAKSQSNNHHTSEAAGLITVGALFPHIPNSKRLLRRGLKEMNRACETLILSDGGSSQYSSNYHRAFLHGIVFANAALRAAGRVVPDSQSRALHRATAYWSDLMDPVSGLVPMIGHDDGANILPTARGIHRDARPSASLCEAVCNERTTLPNGPWDESPFWLGFDASQLSRTLVERPESGNVSYPKMGIHILWNGDYRVIFRCGPYDFRPAHDDQLHVDIWHKGEALCTAPGTYSYNPTPGLVLHTEGWQFHNTVRAISDTSMRQVSGFLFSHWREAVPTIEGGTRVAGVMGAIQRSISVETDKVTVFDSSPEQMIQTWHLSSSDLIATETPTKLDHELMSTGYGFEPVASGVITATGSRITSTIQV